MMWVKKCLGKRVWVFLESSSLDLGRCKELSVKRSFVLDCAIGFTAVSLVSVTGNLSVKESFIGMFTDVGSTCDRSAHNASNIP
jgi:hypothetical protein